MLGQTYTNSSPVSSFPVFDAYSNSCSSNKIGPTLIKLVSFKNGHKRVLRAFSNTAEDKVLDTEMTAAVPTEKPLKSGRWTKEECQRFEEALRRFGRRWKKVETFVGTRNGVQVRSHAQKYFLKHKDAFHSSAAPTNSCGLGADAKAEAKNCLNAADTCVEQSAVKARGKEEASEHSQNESNLNGQCSFLLAHMKNFGFNNINDIYSEYTRLDDWVKTSSQIIPVRTKKSFLFPVDYKIF